MQRAVSPGGLRIEERVRVEMRRVGNVETGYIQAPKMENSRKAGSIRPGHKFLQPRRERRGNLTAALISEIIPKEQD